ncbi:hypothetical protein SD436_10770 [Streptococcus sp. 2A/TPW/M5]
MNKTKKWLGLGLSVLSVSVLVACGSSNSQSNNSSKETKTEKIATTEKSSEKNQHMLLVIKLSLINKLSIQLQKLNGLMNAMILTNQILIKC